MPKYSSRVNPTGGAQQKKPGAKKKTKVNTAAKSILSTGGALDAAKIKPSEKAKLQVELIQSARSDNITPDTAATSGGNFPAIGGGLETGGDITSGGNIVDDIKDVAKKVVGAAKEVKSAVKKSRSPGELSDSLQGVVSKLTHNGMIQVLQHMSPQQFHVLQGVAGAHLPNFNSHPLSGVSRKVLGGSFTHPRNISKMASRDIVRSISPQQLASALHMEMMDMQRGMPVGGGLLDSIKHNFNRGLSGLKSGIAAGTRLGNVLHGALSTGIKVGQVFSPVVDSLFPGAGQLIESGISSAEALKAGLEVGVKAGEALEKGLEGISPIDTGAAAQDKPTVAQPFTAPLVGADEPSLPPEEGFPAPPSFAPPAPPSFEEISQDFPGLSQQELINMGLLT